MIGGKMPEIIVPWFVCTHCNNAGPLNECPRTPHLGPMCPRCDYCVQVLDPKYSDDSDKRIRAVVLAACVEVCRIQEESVGETSEAKAWGGAAKYIREELEKLQPAAADLEALLLEGELKGRIDERERARFAAPDRDLRLAELKADLEKARAEGKG